MKSDRIFSLNKFKDRRRDLRKSATPQEKKILEYLRNSKLGVKFRRQHSIGAYIADFYCPEIQLIIELDGAQHKEKETEMYDADRSYYFKGLNIRVVRFWNSEIDKDIEKIIAEVKKRVGPSTFEGEGQG